MLSALLVDDAGQFAAVGRHALCWVHAERLAHKLDTFTDLASSRSTADAQHELDLEFLRRSKGLTGPARAIYEAGVSLCARGPIESSDIVPASLHWIDCSPGCTLATRPLLMKLERPVTLPHQRLRERHPLPGDLPQGSAPESSKRRRPRLPLMPSSVSPRPAAKHGVAAWDYLGSRLQRPRSAGHSAPAGPRPLPWASSARCRPRPGFCPCYLFDINRMGVKGSTVE